MIPYTWLYLNIRAIASVYSDPEMHPYERSNRQHLWVVKRL